MNLCRKIKETEKAGGAHETMVNKEIWTIYKCIIPLANVRVCACAEKREIMKNNL